MRRRRKEAGRSKFEGDYKVFCNVDFRTERFCLRLLPLSVHRVALEDVSVHAVTGKVGAKYWNMF